MNKKMVIGAALGTVIAVGAVGGLVLKPVTQEYVAPIVKEKLNNAIQGSATYDSLSIGWTGKVIIKNLTVNDTEGKPVLEAPELDVSLSPIGAIKAAVFNGEPLGAISGVTLINPMVYLRENEKNQWNVSHIVKDDHPEEPFSYRGDVTVKEGKAQVTLNNGQSYGIDKINGHVDFSKYPKSDVDVACAIEGQSLSAKGFYNMKGKDFKVALKSASFDAVPFKKLIAQNEETHFNSGKLKDVDITLSRDDKGIFQYEGHASVDELQVDYKNYKVKEGTGKFLFTPEGITIESLKGTVNDSPLDLSGKVKYAAGIIEGSDLILKAGKGAITGAGWYNTIHNSYEASLTAKEADISSIGALLGKDMNGIITGHVYAKGSAADLQEVKGQFNGKDVRYDEWFFDSLEGALIGNHGEYTLSYLNAQMGQGFVTANGRYGPNGLQIMFDGREMPLQLIESTMGVSASGTANVTGTIKGDIENPDVTFRFGSNGGSLHGVEFSQAAGDGQFIHSKLTLNNMLINTGKGTFTVGGIVDLGASRAMSLKGHIHNIRAEAIVEPFSKVPLTGWLDGDFTVTGTVDNPLAVGFIHLSEGSFMNQLIQDAMANLTYENHALHVPEFKVMAYGSSIRGQGSVVGDKLDFQMSGSHLNTRYLIENNPYNMEGFIDFYGSLKGTTSQPIFTGHIIGNQVTINESSLEDIEGDIYADPNIINVRAFKFRQGEGKYNLHGGYRIASQELFGSADVTKGSVASLIKTFNIPIYNLDGFLDGHVDLGGNMKNPSVDVKGEISKTSIKGTVMGTSKIDISFANKVLKMKQFVMPIGQGFFAAKGTADLKGAVDLEVVANEVPIEYVVALTGQEIPVTGKIIGAFVMKGETASPKSQMSVTFENLTYNGVNIDKAYALGTLKDGVIKIEQIFVERAGYKASMYGTVPLRAFTAKIGEKDKANFVNLKVGLDNADLGALPLFVPFIEHGEGPTKGNLTITGPLSNIKINGQLSVKNGLLRLKEVKSPLENINGAINFTGSKADINLGLTMGKGNAKLVGNAAWDTNRMTTYGGHLDLNRLEVDSSFFRGPLVGQFDVLPGNIPTIKGHVNLDDTTIDIPLAFTTSKSAFNAAFDIDIEAPNKFRFYNSVLYDLILGGKVHVGGTLDYPQLEGNVNVQQGTVKYLNNRFKVMEGSARFNRPGSFLPSIELKATTDVSTYKIDLGLKGPAEQMELNLTASPALSQQQIISLLTVRTLDINEGGLGQHTIGNLLNAGLEIVVFGAIENTVKNKFNLDRFSINNSYLDPFKRDNRAEARNTLDTLPTNYYTVEVGKYLFPNFMVTVGTGLNYSLSRVGFEYKINKYFDVTGWKTTNNNAFVGAQFKYRF